jgi:uncharacterized protein with FMN-binding domain
MPAPASVSAEHPSAIAAPATPDAPPAGLGSLAAAAVSTPAASLPAVTQVAQLAAAPAASAASKYKDGSYTGWGTSRHGDIEATVVISAGRIQSARISQCWTRYSCSVIDPLPPQVPVRQSAEVDYVSGATQSTNAFYYAVIEALNKAK